MGMIKTAVRTQLFDLPSPMAVFDRLNGVLPAVKESHMYATCTALRIFASESGRYVPGRVCDRRPARYATCVGRCGERCPDFRSAVAVGIARGTTLSGTRR